MGGITGGFFRAAGLFPRACLAIVRAVAAGDTAQARTLNAGLEPLWALFRAHSSLRVVYALADHMSLCRAAPPLPIRPLPMEIRAEIAATVRALSLE